jgi:hypothetical protein
MMATTRKSLQVQPSELEALLPWHAAGTLDRHDTRQVEEALARDLLLAARYAGVRQEHAGTVALNERLGAPSPRVVQKLFAAIDAEAAQNEPVSTPTCGWLATLSPRALAWSAALAALLLLLQAGVIGAFLAGQYLAAQDALPRAFVRFEPDARVSDITAFLDANQAVVESTAGGMFRLQFGHKPMSRQETAGLIARLQNQRIIKLAAPAQ